MGVTFPGTCKLVSCILWLSLLAEFNSSLPSKNSEPLTSHAPYIPLSRQPNDDPNNYNHSIDDMHWSVLLKNYNPINSVAEYRSQCEPLEMGLCKNLWYNQTKMPNMFHHLNQYEAGFVADQFKELINTNCSKDLHFFICSVFTPICLNDYNYPLEPCRPVCERAREGCEPILKHHAFQWPKELDCSRFPIEDNANGKLCMDTESEYREEKSHKLHHGEAVNQFHSDLNKGVFIYHPTKAINKKPKDSHIIDLDDISNTDDYIDMLVSSAPSKAINSYVKISKKSKCKCHCNQPYIKVSSKLHPLYNKVRTGGLLNCMQPCFSGLLYYHITERNSTKSGYHMHYENYISNEDIIKSEEDHNNFKSMQSWIKVWTSLAIISVLSNIVRVSIKQTVKTFKQKLAMYAQHDELGLEVRQHALTLKLSLCHLCIIAGYAVRLFVGHREVACGPKPISPSEDGAYLVTTMATHAGSNKSLCLITFILVYYGTMSSYTWWLFSTLEVFLVHAKQWDVQRLRQYTKPLEYITWILPAIQTVICLTLPSYDTDTVAGICFVGSTSSDNLIALVIGPSTMYLITGWLTLLITSISILSYKNQHPSNSINLLHNLQYLLSSKFTIFIFTSAFPRSFFVFVLLYEYYHYDEGTLAKLCPCKENFDINSLIVFYKTKYAIWLLICIFDIILVTFDLKSLISSSVMNGSVVTNTAHINTNNTTYLNRFKRDLMLTSVHHSSEQRLVASTPIGSTLSSDAYSAHAYSSNPINQNDHTIQSIYGVDSDSQHYASTSRLISYSKNVVPTKI